MIRIHRRLAIPESELSYATSRSSGPGGQRRDKVETRVTLLFDVDASPTLRDDQKRAIHRRLGNRIDAGGVLAVTSQEHRSQAANREAATERFAELLAEALSRKKRRKRTKVPRRAKRRRLEEKKRRSEKKRRRRSPPERWPE